MFFDLGFRTVHVNWQYRIIIALISHNSISGCLIEQRCTNRIRWKNRAIGMKFCKKICSLHTAQYTCNGPLSQEAVYLVAFERTCQVKLYYENVDNKCSKRIIIWQKKCRLKPHSKTIFSRGPQCTWLFFCFWVTFGREPLTVNTVNEYETAQYFIQDYSADQNKTILWSQHHAKTGKNR